jgi:hypothetical protein
MMAHPALMNVAATIPASSIGAFLPPVLYRNVWAMPDAVQARLVRRLKERQQERSRAKHPARPKAPATLSVVECTRRLG